MEILKLISLLFLFVPLQAYVVSDQWGLEPLGPEVPVAQEGEAQIRRPLKSHLVVYPASGEPFVWAEQGEVRCLLVVRHRANASEQAAARLLSETLGQMTGGEFSICTENEIELVEDAEGIRRVRQLSEDREWPYVVWIGATERAREQGITAEDLSPEGYRLESRGNEFFLVGNDSSPGRLRPANGTRFAAVALLERHMGVRWLWPGELGTVIPHVTTLVTPALKEQDEPALHRRTIRNMSINDRARQGLRVLEREDEDYQQAVLTPQSRWLGNHRTGTAIRVNSGHAYGSWYQKFGESHPEWFALQPGGTRIPNERGRERLCMSNPEVALQAARQVLNDYERSPEISAASISPNDGSRNSFCMCESCRRLDPINGPLIRFQFHRGRTRFFEEYPALSDRVAVFYNRIAEAVTAVKPDAIMAGYAYDTYRDAPLGVDLHPSILIGFVGLSYWNESRRQVDLERWNRWSYRASQLFLRPNIFHEGEGLPGIYPRMLAEDIRHCYQTGMTGVDFDSLIGNWATQGLNYYVLSKLLWDPSIDVDEVIEDYCRHGFGPAAEGVSRYFDELERATREVALSHTGEDRAGIREEEADQELLESSQNWKEWEQRYFLVFTEERVQGLRNILQEAYDAVEGDPVIQERIIFLGIGLQYADLYRDILLSKSESREQLRNWFLEVFETRPQVVNSAFLLWRSRLGRIPRV